MFRLRTGYSAAATAAFLTALALLWPSGGSASGQFIQPEPDASSSVAGQLVVHFRPGTTAAQRDALLSVAGATVQREMSLADFFVASVPQGQEEQAGRRLAVSPAIVTVESDVVRQPASAPNDPLYASMQWNMQAIGLDAARELSDGSGVTVAVLDTGIAYEYYDPGTDQYFAEAPDLMDTTFVDPCDLTGGRPCWCTQEVPVTCECDIGVVAPCQNRLRDVHANDDYGHGTHVAGTIAQSTDNGYGTAGIAPKALIMPVKVCRWNRVFDQEKEEYVPKYGCPTSLIVEGIEYAVALGAGVINISVADPSPSSLFDAALALAQQSGVAVVGAAGNDGSRYLGYPAADSSVIAVGAVGPSKVRSEYSNYGQGAQEHRLDLVAPGGDPDRDGSYIWQQTYEKCTDAQDFSSFRVASACAGTSMAAAHVSGVVALVKSQYPDTTLDQVRTILACSAEDLGAPGYDEVYGWGLVRADRALQDADHDDVPDCIDTLVVTPTPQPTFAPPLNQCPGSGAASPSPSPDPMETMPATGSPTPMPTRFVPCGDVDCSGSVDAIDALDIAGWSTGVSPVPACIGHGYVTCDDLLDVSDAAAILRKVALGSQLPGCAGGP